MVMARQMPTVRPLTVVKSSIQAARKMPRKTNTTPGRAGSTVPATPTTIRMTASVQREMMSVVAMGQSGAGERDIQGETGLQGQGDSGCNRVSGEDRGREAPFSTQRTALQAGHDHDTGRFMQAG